MEYLHTGEELKGLRRRMQTMSIRARLETEGLERYPAVIERLRDRGPAF
ncbi:MAG: hypothetical protein MUE60_08310 [Candidatus Eisenbacteria bacterium]|jgi:hypothetical protein|nr:hypothetical protein [Candidatus Eisenbacteria bacterium]